jgi:hypothetical protein
VRFVDNGDGTVDLAQRADQAAVERADRPGRTRSSAVSRKITFLWP